MEILLLLAAVVAFDVLFVALILIAWRSIGEAEAEIRLSPSGACRVVPDPPDSHGRFVVRAIESLARAHRRAESVRPPDPTHTTHRPL
jgi:hypothetical protein